MTTSQTKLFVGGLSWGTIDSTLVAEFSKFGPIEEATIVRDKITGRSRGFGFVRFANAKDAADAQRLTDGQVFDGRAIRVDFASEKRRLDHAQQYQLPGLSGPPYSQWPVLQNSPMLSMYQSPYPQQYYQPYDQYEQHYYGPQYGNSMAMPVQSLYTSTSDVFPPQHDSSHSYDLAGDHGKGSEETQGKQMTNTDPITGSR